MPIKSFIAECCGVDYFYGFDLPKDTVKEWFQKTFDSTTGFGVGWDMFNTYEPEKLKYGSYFSDAGPGMYLIFLSDKQGKAFAGILEKYEFKLIAGPFRNPRMKNLTNVVIYGRINTIDWYGKFMKETAREIWNKNLTSN